MQQRKISKRLERNILVAVLLVIWVCIALCVIQIVQTAVLRAQVKEQGEQIRRACNAIETFHGAALEAQSGQGIIWDGFGELESGGGAVGNSASDTVGGEGMPCPQPVEGTLPQAESLSYPQQCGLDYVDKPQDRTARQVLERLEELGCEDERIAAIRQNSGLYPERLLEALANNPEMADFVVRYLEEHEPGGLTESEKQEDFPLFLQWDPRWGYASYGKNSCIAVSGCGPTCLSMVLYYLTGNEELTPDVIGDYSMENGYYLPGTGTLWALFENTAPLYGVYVSQPDPSEWEMKAALDGGAVLVCSMGPGDFTAGGHFIVLYGYDEDGFLINDPNCVARSRVSWSYEQLRRQMKHLWVFETKQDLPVYDYVSVTDPVW